MIAVDMAQIVRTCLPSYPRFMSVVQRRFLKRGWPGNSFYAPRISGLSKVLSLSLFLAPVPFHVHSRELSV